MVSASCFDLNLMTVGADLIEGTTYASNLYASAYKFSKPHLFDVRPWNTAKLNLGHAKLNCNHQFISVPIAGLLRKNHFIAPFRRERLGSLFRF